MEVFEILRRIIRDFCAVVFLEETGVDLLLRRLELGPDIVLFADEDELAGRGRILFLRK